MPAIPVHRRPGLTLIEQKYLPYAINAGRIYTIPTHWIMGIIATESAFNPHATRKENSDWSYGLMQVRQQTANSLMRTKVPTSTLLMPRFNIDLGTRYLRIQLDRYGGNILDAISAYNAGSTRPGGPYPNQRYVEKVALASGKYQRGESGITGVAFGGLSVPLLTIGIGILAMLIFMR